MTKNNPTLKTVHSGGYELYWPHSGSFLHIPTIQRMTDGMHEFLEAGQTFEIDRIPVHWDGKEIEVTVQQIEPKL